MTEAVRLQAVAKNYGPVRAVDGIDLSIARGQTVALLGPNGAGKSTTINMLLGLLEPTAGTVRVFGSSPTEAVRAGKVGAMLQESGFAANATVRELVELARALYRDPLPTAEILATADLAELAGRRLDKLSGARRSGCASRSPWPATPNCSCSTSRPPRWTWRAARRSGRPCAATPPPAAPCCSRRTTSKRPTTSPTG
ncbi:ATP-binding cassette domain-containing protein [Catellatospora coxensis]